MLFGLFWQFETPSLFFHFVSACYQFAALSVPLVSLVLFSYGEKRGSSRQPFVTVPYLNCFHGFPFRSIHTSGVPPPPTARPPPLRESKLSQGLFRRGIFDFLLPSPSPRSLFCIFQDRLFESRRPINIIIKY